MIYIGSRYETATTASLPDKRAVPQVTVFRGNSTFRPEQFIHYVIRPGDRLDRIAEATYGDSSLWWVIADANDFSIIPDPLPIGVVLRVPRGSDIR